jgi:glycosyltransferase involved in cell wall biosynthesis
MRIGIDCRSISIEGGVREYLINLIKNLIRIDKNNEYFLYYSKRNELGTFKSKNIHEILIPLNSRIGIPFWEQIKLKKQAQKDNLDILHSPKNTCPVNLHKNIKSIITFLDITPFIYKNEMAYLDMLYWRFFIPKSLKRANRIVSISNSTSKDINSLFPRYNNKIDTIYLGVDKNKVRKSIKKEDFFLFVGTLRKRKNVKRILEAFSRIKEKNFKLYLAGKNLDQQNNIRKAIKNLKLEKKAILLGRINEDKLKELYSKAKAYLYPSLYEGFGLPILEAQASGCPVITSNISSMPEVAGKGALLVNPNSVEEISQAMERIINDKKLRNKLIKEGYKNLKRFSWEKCARETLKVYEEVYNEK